MLGQSLPSKSGGEGNNNKSLTSLPAINLPPNKRTISLPEVPTFPTANEGDWRQKLQLESNHVNDVLSRMAGGGGMPNNNTNSFRSNVQYFGNSDTANAIPASAAGTIVAAAGMSNNNDNISTAPPAAAAGGASNNGNREQKQMEAELKRMQKENEDLLRLISSRQQQLDGGSGLAQAAAAGGSAGTNDYIFDNGGKGAAESDISQMNNGASGNIIEGRQSTSSSAAGGASSTNLSGMNMNVMGGMMGMNSNNMNMMMYNSTMMGGMNNMMNYNNSHMMPYSMSLMSTNNNNNNSLMLPSSSTKKPPTPHKLPNNTTNANSPTLSTIETTEDPNWEERYTELQHFKSEHGHTRVPARYKSNPKLGRWVMTQRRQFTVLMQGFPSALTTERMNRLNDVGFVWALRADPVTMWNRKFGELKGYKRLFGNCMVPQRYQPNPKLGTWVHTQRRQYKLLLEGKKSAMNSEKIKALDSIGFFWMAKQKDRGAVAVGETLHHHRGGGVDVAALAAAPPLLPGMGKGEGYGEEVDEGGDD